MDPVIQHTLHLHADCQVWMCVHRNGAWTLGQRWIQLQQRRCRRNTKSAGAGAAGTRTPTALPSPSSRRRWISRLWEPKWPCALSHHGSAIPPPLVAPNKNGTPQRACHHCYFKMSGTLSKRREGRTPCQRKLPGTFRKQREGSPPRQAKIPTLRQVLVDSGWTHQNIETIEPHAAGSFHQFPRKKQPITCLV